MRNPKFHLLAIATIVICVSGVFYFTGLLDKPPPPQAPLEPQGPGYQGLANARHFITIWHASWALNCIEDYEKAREVVIKKNRRIRDISKHASIPAVPEKDNALAALSKSCNGQDQCEFKADHRTFGTEPLRRCRPTLQVEYRCYDIDKRRIIDVGQNTPVSIDCRKK